MRVEGVGGTEGRRRKPGQIELKRNILLYNFPLDDCPFWVDSLLIYLLILISFYSNGRKRADQRTLIHPKGRKLRETIPFPKVLAKVALS